mmetsp:Transcript_15971/g.47988  ORF Transcript_15971/g.47988 Transcript_15971/m.47988 type:complete len:234 (-) Transcript_15971:382-1083(-)|eukprot:CAMPEP_0206141344 /NCGR_PEP_ID=MMETSP1473-20131121/12591_1 /ASSEMBLY_ACC=CAM_ASM_001109 /TAXON_ID=1461547 /ORGANISM="Stichococcus sp, Strain RCC1054" /LENGTH=233 /DNA_ID=CAMNT_0053535869 /DNA_START=126 /DNA_END=827 /DNA_ORIENTATION=-
MQGMCSCRATAVSGAQPVWGLQAASFKRLDAPRQTRLRSCRPNPLACSSGGTGDSGVCSSINARPEASVSCGITNDIDSTIVSSGRSSNESQQLFGLDNLAAAVSSPSLCTSLVFLGVLAALAAQGGAAHAADSADSVMTHHHSAQAVFGDLASEEDFWGNVGAYMRFFFTVMLGSANIITKPFREAAKSPVSTALVVLLLVGLVIFMSSVVKLMMGVNADDTAAFDLLTGMQ